MKQHSLGKQHALRRRTICRPVGDKHLPSLRARLPADEPGQGPTALGRAAATDRERQSVLEGYIIDLVRELLGGTTAHIGPASTMVMLGLDSLGAVSLRVRLERALRITIDPGVIWVKPTPAALAGWLLERLGHTSHHDQPDAPDQDTTASPTSHHQTSHRRPADTARSTR
ncbi:acyl carrier protein [Streptomyces sp. KLMMK]|uniref:acyl carrier protein n=1 Tax=Streptomyces sp. KLMMK TaxID=3109353 RepID=UPI00300ADAD1